MVRKTRRHTSSKKTGVSSIPELRRSFEYIEAFVNGKIAAKESKESLIKDLRKEWANVFGKDLNKVAADAFICDRMSHSRPHRRRTLKGGSHALAGAPLDYTTRPGMYLAPGQIPTASGYIPLANGGESVYGSYTKYVDSGFFSPQIAQGYDPIKGQSTFLTPHGGMGSNAVQKGGAGRKSRKVRRGGSMGSLLSQAFTRPITSSSPPGPLQDMQDMWHGKAVGVSSDQVQRQAPYHFGNMYPNAVNIRIL
jgi:hypothetical protein